MPIRNMRWFLPMFDENEPIPDNVFANRVASCRREALSESDWRMLPDAPGDQTAWETYRADLRDGPAILATRDGDLVTLPDPPEAG